MTQNLPKDLSAIEDLFVLLQGFIQAEGIDETTAFQLTVAAEELFTNMVKYGGHSAAPVTVTLERNGNWLQMQLVDHGVSPFDVTSVALADLDQPIEQRRAGGMGLHLVRAFADELGYRYENGNSIITFKKKLESADVRD